MKFRSAKLLILLGAFAASAQTGQLRLLTESQALTRAVPSVAVMQDTTKALKLDDVAWVRVSVCAASGQTLSGAGSIQAYWFDPETSLVQRNPELDKSITVTSTSCQGAACQCQVFADLQAGVRTASGTLLYATNGVTVSGGTTVSVKYTAWLSHPR